MIKGVFVSNHDKLQQALLRVEYYNMMTVFMVPTVRSKYGTKPNKIFNNDEKNLFLHWDSFRWEDVCLWQKTIHKWGLDDDCWHQGSISRLMFSNCSGDYISSGINRDKRMGISTSLPQFIMGCVIVVSEHCLLKGLKARRHNVTFSVEQCR